MIIGVNIVSLKVISWVVIVVFIFELKIILILFLNVNIFVLIRFMVIIDVVEFDWIKVVIIVLISILKIGMLVVWFNDLWKCFFDIFLIFWEKFLSLKIKRIMVVSLVMVIFRFFICL